MAQPPGANKVAFEIHHDVAGGGAATPAAAKSRTPDDGINVSLQGGVMFASPANSTLHGLQPHSDVSVNSQRYKPNSSFDTPVFVVTSEHKVKCLCCDTYLTYSTMRTHVKDIKGKHQARLQDFEPPQSNIYPVVTLDQAEILVQSRTQMSRKERRRAKKRARDAVYGA